jgi:hypothetical protein
LVSRTSRDLAGIELKVEPANGDGVHRAWLTRAKAASLFLMPMTSVVSAGSGRANTTLHMVFTQP